MYRAVEFEFATLSLPEMNSGIAPVHKFGKFKCSTTKLVIELRHNS